MCVDLGTEEEITVFKIGDKFFSRHNVHGESHVFPLKKVSTIPAMAKSLTPNSKKFKIFMNGPDVDDMYYKISDLTLKTNPSNKVLEFENLGKKTFLFKKTVDVCYDE